MLLATVATEEGGVEARLLVIGVKTLPVEGNAPLAATTYYFNTLDDLLAREDVTARTSTRSLTPAPASSSSTAFDGVCS